MTTNIKITSIARHRNGVTAEPFHVCLFQDVDIEMDMMAIVFDRGGHLAVLNIKETAKGNIAFGDGNSWRADHFEKDLRKAIVAWNKTQ